MKICLLSVDFQKDFSAKGGVCYRPRACVKFLKETLFLFCKEKRIKLAEIISDYRTPRMGGRSDCCRPGDWGYESEVPSEIKKDFVWLKCMNSPIWVRKNIGNPKLKAGQPYHDPKSFDGWLKKVIGSPEKIEVVLFGLTLDCCVLCTAQELKFRGYKVSVLVEGVDTYSGNLNDKNAVLKQPFSNWGKPIKWRSLKRQLV